MLYRNMGFFWNENQAKQNSIDGDLLRRPTIPQELSVISYDGDSKNEYALYKQQ